MFYLLSQFDNSTCKSGNTATVNKPKARRKPLFVTVSNALNVKLNVTEVSLN